MGHMYKKPLYRLERSFLDSVMGEGLIRLTSEDDQKETDFYFELPRSLKRKKINLHKKQIHPHMSITVKTLIDKTALPAEKAGC